MKPIAMWVDNELSKRGWERRGWYNCVRISSDSQEILGMAIYSLPLAGETRAQMKLWDR